MNLSFALLAAALVIASLLVVVWPLWRTAAAPRATAAAILLACVLPVAAVLLYRGWSTFDWSEPGPEADSPVAMVARLARRLEKQPDDRDGWLKLGRSYLVLEQFPLAARAFQRADRLAGGTDAEAVLGWAESLFRANESEIEGRAGRLFERALQLDPESGKAQLFAAIAAQRRGELALARERFAKVLAANPPEELRGAIEAQIAQLDRLVAGAPASAGVAAAVPASVLLTVTLDPKFLSAKNSAAPLFVLARRPGERGPPLAVKRLAARFPLQVELSAADAMLPGRELVGGETVEVVARLALSGAPTESAGDLSGRANYRVGSGTRVSIVIDRVTP